MAFGQKTGSLKNLKKSLAKKSGGAFIKYIPKNGSLNVRFIQEPEEWVNYLEHYDKGIGRSFPCNGEASCPGCSTQERKSSRYLANAVDLDDADRVIPLQMPKDLANRLVVKYEKWGSLTDRDIELSRSGEGLDTVYDLEADAKSPVNLGKYTPLDLLKVLEDSYNSVFGTDDADEDEDDATLGAPPQVRARKKSAAASVFTGSSETASVEPDLDDDEDEDEDEAPAAEAAPEPTFAVDDADSEEAEAEVDDDATDYDEETLRGMPLGALRRVARDEFGVDAKGKSKDQLIEAIFESGEVEADEDGPGF